MKKFYEEPVMRVDEFEVENILTGSSLQQVMSENGVSNVQTVTAETVLKFIG